MISALHFAFLFILPKTLGQIRVNRCDAASLYNVGKCRLGRCLDNEYALTGNNFCDVYSQYWSAYYTRCVENLPCCSRGGRCSSQCNSGETAINARTDCGNSGSRCCVPGTVGSDAGFILPQGECGVVKTLGPRIIGGQSLAPSSWPWIVRLVYPNSVNGVCAGVLVDDDTVLTVAHCVSDFRTNEVQVLLGDHDMTRREPTEEVFNLRDMELNPNFRVGYRGNDLAVLKLDRPVTFSNSKSPVCLPDPAVPIFGTDGPIDSSQCFIAGWGVTENGKVSATVRTAPVKLMDSATCNAIIGTVTGDYSGLPSDIICTDTSATKADACSYDDGGMLVCLDAASRYSLVGLVSEYSCGRLPTLYTRVSNYTNSLWARL